MTSDEKLAQLDELFGSYKAEWLNEKIFHFFAAPSYFTSLKDKRPCVLMGGRGTGKTTVLRGLSYMGQYALNNDDIRMMQVAVATKYQGEGIGTELVKYAEKRAKEAGYHRLIMYAMLSVVGFYEHLGFKQEGDIFDEDGITFAKMVKLL